MTQGISGSGARRWSVRKHCRAGQVSDNSARWLTCLGGRGKADCGTQAERTWSRGPAGSVPRRSFGSFPIAGKGTRPAGRNPFRHPTAGTREGRPLIRHGMRRDTFPPAGGKALGAALEAAPMGCPSAFARPCGTSQVREWQAGPASCVKAGTKTAGKTSVSPARVSG